MTIPYVVEQTNKGERTYDIYSRLLKLLYQFQVIELYHLTLNEPTLFLYHIANHVS